MKERCSPQRKQFSYYHVRINPSPLERLKRFPDGVEIFLIVLWYVNSSIATATNSTPLLIDTVRSIRNNQKHPLNTVCFVPHFLNVSFQFALPTSKDRSMCTFKTAIEEHRQLDLSGTGVSKDAKKKAFNLKAHRVWLPLCQLGATVSCPDVVPTSARSRDWLRIRLGACKWDMQPQNIHHWP